MTPFERYKHSRSEAHRADLRIKTAYNLVSTLEKIYKLRFMINTGIKQPRDIAEEIVDQRNSLEEQLKNMKDPFPQAKIRPLERISYIRPVHPHTYLSEIVKMWEESDGSGDNVKKFGLKKTEIDLLKMGLQEKKRINFWKRELGKDTGQ